MISQKDVSDIAEKITRRFEIELPLEIETFTVDNENEYLYISFHKGEISRTFELSKGLTLEFDTESRILGLKIESFVNYLPSPEA